MKKYGFSLLFIKAKLPGLCELSDWMKECGLESDVVMNR